MQFPCAHILHAVHCTHFSPGRLLLNGSSHSRHVHASSSFTGDGFAFVVATNALAALEAFALHFLLYVFCCFSWIIASFSGVSVKTLVRPGCRPRRTLFRGHAFGNGLMCSGEITCDVDGTENLAHRQLHRQPVRRWRQHYLLVVDAPSQRWLPVVVDEPSQRWLSVVVDEPSQRWLSVVVDEPSQRWLSVVVDEPLQRWLSVVVD